VSNLHFETCYYQAIEWCCAHQINTFEGGAQGEHKLARGFLATETFSAHWLRDEDFQQAVGDFIGRETAHMAHVMDEFAESSPYKNSQPI
jgi:uncharacterized protein